MTRCEIIGDATLYLGDAREIVPTIEAADLIFTDPPYGHNNNNDDDLIHVRERALGKKNPGGASPPSRPIANDGPEANELTRWLFRESRRVLRPGGCCCCCCGGGGGPDPQFARWSLWMDEALSFKQMVIFDKGPMGMGWHYRRSYETILVGMKPGAACRWFDKSGRVENVIRPGAFGIRKIIPQSTDHPTSKPPELAMHFIRLHSTVGDLVLDPFAGGGSTGIAALRMERKFIGVEIDPVFFDLACKRIDAEYRSPRLSFENMNTPETQQDALL